MPESPSNEIAEAIVQAKLLDDFLASNNMDNQPVGQAAKDAAYTAVNTLVEQSPHTINQLFGMVDEIKSARTKYAKVRAEMHELGLQTTEIDSRVAGIEKALTEGDRLVVAYIGQTGISGATPEATPAEPEPVEQPPAVESIDERQTILLGFGRKEGKPNIVIGNRLVKLSGAQRHQADYSAERFAAAAVMSKLSETEKLGVYALWDKIYIDILGFKSAPEFDRRVMFHVRSFLTTLLYRKQAIFLHNGLRKDGTAYYLNPELNYEVGMDGSDDEVRAFAQQLLEQSRLRSSHVDEDNSIETEVPTGQAANAPAEETPENLSLSEGMPTIAELYSFLVKIQRTMSNESTGLDIRSDSMLSKLYEITKTTLQELEQQHPLDTVDLPQNNVAAVREDAIEKFIRITEDDNLLNKLLHDDTNSAYGEKVSAGVIEFTEVILDMDETERNLLHRIIGAKASTNVTVYTGSFTRGQLVTGTETLFDRLQSDAATEISEPVNVAHQEDPTPEQTEDIVNIPQQPDDTNTDTMKDDSPSAGETQPNEVEEFVRQTVDDTIALLQEKGLSPDSVISSHQAESMFGIRIKDIVSARENGQLRKDAKKGLSFKDAAQIIMLRSSDSKVRHHSKAIGKQLDRRIKELQKSAE